MGNRLASRGLWKKTAGKIMGKKLKILDIIPDSVVECGEAS